MSLQFNHLRNDSPKKETRIKIKICYIKFPTIILKETIKVKKKGECNVSNLVDFNILLLLLFLKPLTHRTLSGNSVLYASAHSLVPRKRKPVIKRLSLTLWIILAALLNANGCIAFTFLFLVFLIYGCCVVKKDGKTETDKPCGSHDANSCQQGLKEE